MIIKIREQTLISKINECINNHHNVRYYIGFHTDSKRSGVLYFSLYNHIEAAAGYGSIKMFNINYYKLCNLLAILFKPEVIPLIKYLCIYIAKVCCVNGIPKVTIKIIEGGIINFTFGYYLAPEVNEKYIHYRWSNDGKFNTFIDNINRLATEHINMVLTNLYYSANTNTRLKNVAIPLNNILNENLILM
jgi:hypothetical protein